MFKNSSATILFGGALTIANIEARPGIRQGCRSSAPLWALLFEPLARSITAVVQPSLGLVGCFADGLACGFRDVVDGLRRALPVFRSLLQADGLALSLAKAVLVNSYRLSDAALGEVLRPMLGEDALRIADHAEYLGILIAPGSPTRYWDARVAKYRSRCHHVRSLARPMHDRRLA